MAMLAQAPVAYPLHVFNCNLGHPMHARATSKWVSGCLAMSSTQQTAAATQDSLLVDCCVQQDLSDLSGLHSCALNDVGNVLTAGDALGGSTILLKLTGQAEGGPAQGRSRTTREIHSVLSHFVAIKAKNQ